MTTPNLPFVLSDRLDLSLEEAAIERVWLKRLAVAQNWTSYPAELIARRLKVVEDRIIELAVNAAQKAAEKSVTP